MRREASSVPWRGEGEWVRVGDRDRSLFNCEMGIDGVDFYNITRHKLFINERQAVLAPADADEVPYHLRVLHLEGPADEEEHLGIDAAVLRPRIFEAILSHGRLEDLVERRVIEEHAAELV